MSDDSDDSIMFTDMEDVKKSMLPVLREFAEKVKQNRGKAQTFVQHIVNSDTDNIVDDTYQLNSLFAETKNVDNIPLEHLRSSLKASVQKTYDIGRMHQQNLQEKLKLISQLQKEKTINQQLLRFIDDFCPSFEDTLQQAVDTEKLRIGVTRDLKEETEKLNDTANALDQELRKTTQELKESQNKTSMLEDKVGENARINREKDNVIQRRGNEVSRLQDEVVKLTRDLDDRIQSVSQLEKERNTLIHDIRDLKRRQSELDDRHKHELEELEADFLKKKQKSDSRWASKFEEHLRTSSEALKKCEGEIRLLDKDRNKYFEIAKKLTTELSNYKREINVKAVAYLNNGHQNALSGLLLQQAKDRANEIKLRSMQYPVSPPKHVHEMRRALESTSADSEDDENAPPAKLKKPSSTLRDVARHYDVAAKFQHARSSSTRR